MSGGAKYRIQAVSEMTGVPAATLRAWERRYGIPRPGRSTASYRLYGDEDVAAIRELAELRSRGMSPSEAAQLVKARMDRPEELPAEAGDAPDAYERMCERLLKHISDFDPRGLEDGLRRAMFMGSVTTVFEKVVGPVMVMVGERWHDGRLSVAQEHMATELLSGVARDMLRMVEPAAGAREVVLACFADEEHALPMYGVAYRIVQWGFHPVILGARTPPAAIATAVQELEPAAVGLSMTVTPKSAVARELAEEYGRACGDVPWLVGGLGSEPVREELEAGGARVVGVAPVSALKLIFDELLLR